MEKYVPLFWGEKLQLSGGCDDTLSARSHWDHMGQLRSSSKYYEPLGVYPVIKQGSLSYNVSESVNFDWWQFIGVRCSVFYHVWNWLGKMKKYDISGKYLKLALCFLNEA
jgi:hypothetical protein